MKMHDIQHQGPKRRSYVSAESVSPHDMTRLSYQRASVNQTYVGSMWHRMGAAEATKCLKYCLSWVKYAIRSMEHQMVLLGSSCCVATVKKTMVDTLRKVVDVISRYAGASLPYHAKLTVRGFILNLPNRWEGRSTQEDTSRLLHFGQDAIDMLQSILTTVQHAEAWLYRLRSNNMPLHDDDKQP